MLKGLNCGFGAPVSIFGVTLADLYQLGVRVVRLGMPMPDRSLGELIAETQACAPMRVIWLADDRSFLQELPIGATVELGNERDLEDDPDVYADELRWALDAASRRNQTIVTGGISNLTLKALGWLDVVLRMVPEVEHVAFHRYPYRSEPTDPHPPFHSRLDELMRLKQIAGSRRLWLTEFGYNTGGWFWNRLTDAEVAQHAAWEWRFWSGVVEAACWYQLNDGPSRYPIDRFGIRATTRGGTWKPVAATFAAL